MKRANILLQSTFITALASLTALHAADAPSKQKPNNAVMLGGEWLPGDPHQIDYEKLPRVTAKQPSSVTFATTLALAFINTRIWPIMTAGSGPCGAMVRDCRSPVPRYAAD